MSPRERIADLEALIQCQVHLRRAAISAHRFPDRVNEEIERIEKRIARDQAEVAILKARRDGWREIVDSADDRIAELRQEIILLKNQVKIEQLIRLQQQLNEVDPEVLQRLLEAEEGEEVADDPA